MKFEILRILDYHLRYDTRWSDTLLPFRRSVLHISSRSKIVKYENNKQSVTPIFEAFFLFGKALKGSGTDIFNVASRHFFEEVKKITKLFKEQ